MGKCIVCISIISRLLPALTFYLLRANICLGRYFALRYRSSFFPFEGQSLEERRLQLEAV